VGDMMRDQRVVMRSSFRGDAGGSPGQSISSSIHSFAVSSAAAWASATDAARFRNGTTIPLWLRGSCSGFQTSTLAENVVPTAVSVMRIFQPRYTCSDLLALDSVMEDHLRRESTSAGGCRCDLPLLVRSWAMPAPTNERQALERERAELPGQISAHQAELAVTQTENKARRERLDWQIRNLQKRLAAVEARLV
jgi:hypothetical protein